MARERTSSERGDPPDRDPFNLDTSVVSVPLLKQMEELRASGESVPVVITLNRKYPGGLRAARRRVAELLASVASNGAGKLRGAPGSQYAYADLTADVIQAIARTDASGDVGAIHRIWPDFEVFPLITESVRTVKADAAARAFTALGAGIVWAVVDSGIDRSHRHFREHGNLKLSPDLAHKDFTSGARRNSALTDPFGHGTHVAGIIAGGMTSDHQHEARVFQRRRSEDGEVTREMRTTERICGMAPQASLLSLRVLDEEGKGLASACISALEYVNELNANARQLRVHGVNLSVGYPFDPTWFGCGHSPLCTMVNQLVRSGVVVVVAAGNTGYGSIDSDAKGIVAAGMDVTVNDPGNADGAITVGSTHREKPHQYGVSFFSSKGPTGDGRVKPDLVAPGEKIVSCAAGGYRPDGTPADADYVEQSGTSMAAPHVSGAVAAFLSTHGEFVGQPERVKEIFMSTATDLRRRETFQGRGLIDLMRAIQSV